MNLEKTKVLAPAKEDGQIDDRFQEDQKWIIEQIGLEGTFNSICPQFCSCFGAKSFRCLTLIFLLPNQCLPATSASTNRCHFLGCIRSDASSKNGLKTTKVDPKLDVHFERFAILVPQTACPG